MSERELRHRRGGKGDDHDAAGSRASPLVAVDVALPGGGPALGFHVCEGECVWLRGCSGAGKTSVARVIAGMARSTPFGARVDVRWRAGVGGAACAAMLFQDSVLLNELSVADNIAMAIARSGRAPTRVLVEGVLGRVGLEAKTADMMCEALSGGMRRRAALAQILSLQRRVLILDEPFTGSDAVSVAHITRALSECLADGVGIIVISHQAPALESLAVALTLELPDNLDELASASAPSPAAHLAGRAVGAVAATARAWWTRCGAARLVGGAKAKHDDDQAVSHHPVAAACRKASRATARGRAWLDRQFPPWGYARRTHTRFWDYLLLSLPLVLVAGLMTGMSIVMVVVEVLQRVNTDTLLKHAPQSVTGSMMFSMVRGVVVEKADAMLPVVKRKLVSTVLAYCVIVEIAPLLTAMLMAGRIGGSHAGEVVTMHTTGERDLLKTLGARPRLWSFVPSLLSSVLVAPVLTAACAAAAMVAATYCASNSEFAPGGGGEGDDGSLWKDAWEAATQHNFRGGVGSARGLSTWPPFILLYRSVGFHLLISVAADVCGGRAEGKETRVVPRLITAAVVVASLLIIATDWAYSQMLVRALINRPT